MMNQARKMFLENKGRKDVILFFKMQGVDSDKAETMATEAYKSIREVRKAMMEAAQSGGGGSTTASAPKEGQGGAIIQLALGLIICFAGIIATMSTTSIWYGAIIVGGMMALKGLAGLIS